MSHGFFGVTRAVVIVIAALLLASISAAGQASLATKVTAATNTWTPPRTPWGEPDLQGIWSNGMITPLERPADLAGREFLTDAEIAERERRAVAAATDEARGQDAARDVAGAYNDFWWDRGTKVASNKRTSLIVDPPDGRIPWIPDVRKAQAARAQARQALLEGRSSFESWLDLDTGERCLTDGIPWIPYAYNNNYEVVQSPGHVAILHEMFRELRIIPTDGRPAPDIPQWFGQSRGHWEGNTLVVETTNFADKANYWWAADWRAPRPTLHLVERFTRASDDTLLYEFTLVDPAMFTRPWSAQIPMPKVKGPIYEYACHEGNYGLVDVLSGARAQEKAAATQER